MPVLVVLFCMCSEKDGGSHRAEAPRLSVKLVKVASRVSATARLDGAASGGTGATLPAAVAKTETATSSDVKSQSLVALSPVSPPPSIVAVNASPSHDTKLLVPTAPVIASAEFPPPLQLPRGAPVPANSLAYIEDRQNLAPPHLNHHFHYVIPTDPDVPKLQLPNTGMSLRFGANLNVKAAGGDRKFNENLVTSYKWEIQQRTFELAVCTSCSLPPPACVVCWFGSQSVTSYRYRY